ncbi:MAG: hypothetical protein MMC33_003881 [Icmadophila ericetorum]|nr:hypothetical protein [Icmadophila ericetorum]
MSSAVLADRLILDNFQALISTFSDFLTVAIHTILYERNLYPRTSFLSARKYDYPVRQSRHPKVCQWIQDAVLAVEAELLKGTVDQISLLIYSPDGISTVPLERFVFRPSLPSVPYPERLTPFAPQPQPLSSPTLTDPSSKPAPADAAAETPTGSAPPPTPLRKPIQAINLETQFRSTLSRLSNLHSSLSPLPEGCTFTLIVEIKDDAEPPTEHPTAWIVAEPGLQAASGASAGSSGLGYGGGGNEESSGSESGDEGGTRRRKKKKKKGRDLGGVRTTAVRSVEEGAFGMEVWVEEGSGKIGGGEER